MFTLPFLLFIAFVSAQDVGIRIFLAPQQLPPSVQSAAAAKFNLLFLAINEDSAPFESPSHNVYFSGLNVSSLHVTSGDLGVSTDGLSFTSHDLSGSISFSVFYLPKNTSLEGVAHFTNSTFSLSFIILSAGGHPRIQLTSVAINVQPKNIAFDFPKTVPASIQKEILATFSTFIQTNLTNVAKTKLPPILQAVVGFAFGSGSHSLPIGNLTADISYLMADNPIFTEDQLILDVTGDITVEGDVAPACPIKKNNIPSNYTGPNAVAIGIDGGLIECVFWEGKDPNVVSTLLKSLLPFYFDKRVSLLPEVLGTPSLEFSDSNSLSQSVEVGLYVPFGRADLNETFISFDTNVTVGLDITVNMTSSIASLTITNVTITDLALKELNKKFIAPHFLSQIEGESWPNFQAMIDTKINSLFPLHIPVNLTGYTEQIRNLSFKTGKKYALVSFDLE